MRQARAIGAAARAALDALRDGAAEGVDWNHQVVEMAEAGRRAVRAVERVRVASLAGAPAGDRARLAKEARAAAAEMATTALLALATLPEGER